jgi:hypothetical protein
MPAPIPAQVPSSDSPPAKCPVQGEGGADFLNWSSVLYDDTRFLETYQSRAQHLIKLHGEKLTAVAIARLNSLPIYY